MRKFLSLLGVVVLVIGVAPVFAAKKATTYRFVGLLTAVSVDADTATPDTFTFSMIRANGAGNRWQSAHEGDITASTIETTTFTPAYGDVGSVPSDYEPGDGVLVVARRNTEGALVARSIKMMLPKFEGTLESYDEFLGVFEVRWDRADPVAAAWLNANGDPNPVFVDETEETAITREGEGSPQAGDQIALVARVSEDWGGLDAIAAALHPAEAPEPEPDPEPKPEPDPSTEPAPTPTDPPPGEGSEKQWNLWSEVDALLKTITEQPQSQERTLSPDRIFRRR